MSIRTTSGYESGNELRDRIGLQFFADGGDGGADTGADMDGDFGSDFEAGLMDGGLENQQPTGQDTGEGAAEGLENQQPEGQQGEPKNNQPEGGQEPPQAQQEPPKMVPMTYNGQQIMLPESAVQALRGALGHDPVELLQKGMNYDHKAERELRVLDQFAAAAGVTRAQYLGQLEQMQREGEIKAELEKCRGEFPETPDAALAEIAKNRVAARHAAAQQQDMQRQQKIRQVQQRAQQAVQDARRQAEINAWDEYEKVAGVHKPEDVPPRVMELVQQEGMSPTAAHWRYQAEQAQQKNRINNKNEKNRQASAGSLAGADAASGFEADFLGALKF